MPRRQCYHCKQWIEDGEPHDCWTTTEAALTRDLTEDLRDAWERLRETAADFGEQRIYASHNSIMFSRRACYFFVRPKKTFLEVCVFLDRTVTAPQVRRAAQASKSRVAHMIRITHRDQVEAPITDWLRDAFALSAPAAATVTQAAAGTGKTATSRRPATTSKQPPGTRKERGKPSARTRGTSARKPATTVARARTARATTPTTGGRARSKRR